MKNLVMTFIITLMLVSIASAAYGYGGVGTSVKSNVSISPSASASASAQANASKGEMNKSKDEKGEPVADIIARINLRTGLNIVASENASLGEILRVYLSNGRYAAVKVLPATASANAQAVMKAKCEERNCTVELKETIVNGEAKAAYEVKAEKKAKVLGIFNAKMNVEADVDAETGEIIKVRRPWWSFLATEVDEESSASS